MTWKLVTAFLIFAVLGVGLLRVEPAVAPWYFDDFRLDRSPGQITGIDVIAAAHFPQNKPAPVAERAPAAAETPRAAETTGFASK